MVAALVAVAMAALVAVAVVVAMALVLEMVAASLLLGKRPNKHYPKRKCALASLTLTGFLMCALALFTLLGACKYTHSH